jgi:subtilase family serine protease
MSILEIDKGIDWAHYFFPPQSSPKSSSDPRNNVKIRRSTIFAAVAALLWGSGISTLAQEASLAHKGRIVIPDSGIERPEDVGFRMHTTYQIFVPADRVKFGAEPNSYSLPEGTAPPPGGPPFGGYAFETPASIACVYNLVSTAPGCNPNTFKTNPGGGSKAIGIVDAYDYPTALADLNNFSTQFGLPTMTTSTFKVIFAGGTGGCAGSDPGNDPGWETEQALDVQWSHAMAPKAKIFLVEAASAQISDLLVAEDCASKQVAAAGGGEVSNSWGGSEFSTETSYDSHFVKSTIVFFASSGDSAGTIWPSVSTNVVAVGGTSTTRVNSGSAFGNFSLEAAWEDGGGGLSSYEPRPSYQSVLPGATHRLVPDVSSDANPNTGVWVYDNNPLTGCCWYIVGGTSVSSPTWAGIVNSAGHFAASSNAELTTIYNAFANATNYATDYHDIAYGLCGFYDGNIAATKWDLCTGVGSPKGHAGK